MLEFCDYPGCMVDSDMLEQAIMVGIDALNPYLATLYELVHEVLVIIEDYNDDNAGC